MESDFEERRTKALEGYEVPKWIKVRTLADHLFCRHRVYASCAACGRDVELDLPALVLQYGQDCLFDQVRDCLRCQSCGGKASITIAGRGMASRDGA